MHICFSNTINTKNTREDKFLIMLMNHVLEAISKIKREEKEA